MTLDEARKLKPGDEISLRRPYCEGIRFFIGITKNGYIAYEYASEPYKRSGAYTVEVEAILSPEPVYEWRWVQMEIINGYLYLGTTYYSDAEAVKLSNLVERVLSTKRLRLD